MCVRLITCLRGVSLADDAHFRRRDHFGTGNLVETLSRVLGFSSYKRFRFNVVPLSRSFFVRRQPVGHAGEDVPRTSSAKIVSVHADLQSPAPFEALSNCFVLLGSPLIPYALWRSC